MPTASQTWRLLAGLLGSAFAGMAGQDPAILTSEPSHLVDPLSGTGAFPAPAGDNNLFPGAVMPFGMIQWSPDTEEGHQKGGYFYGDRRISDFSFDHLSGVGGDYGEDFAIMPILGGEPTHAPTRRSEFAVSFSHRSEQASPGYYGVGLDNGIRADLTVTPRTGFGRFRFPEGGAQTIMINAASDIRGSDDAAIAVDPATHAVSGWSLGGHFCNPRESVRDRRKVFFYAVFDRAFTHWSVWQKAALTPDAREGSGAKTGVYLAFDPNGPAAVRVKVGMSYVSVANAQANVAAENPVDQFSDADFDRTVANATRVWNERLSRIEISGGTDLQRRTFYSMLYHAFQAPCVVSDVNGDYQGYDGQVHQTELSRGRRRTQYGVFSGWDIYRSECQLLAMLAPREASDMAQSLLLDYEQSGAFPRWGVSSGDSGAMVGDPAAAMIADFYAFGATDFDTAAALRGLVRAANDPSTGDPRSDTKERDALADYLKLGYVPEYQVGGYGSVSMTLEYCSADFALSQLAESLGDQADATPLLQRAQNWRNHYNPQSGYPQMRRRDGSWAPDFTPKMSRYDRERAFVEGSAAQYLWMVPFNLKGLSETIGGPEATERRLDEFFQKLNAGYSEFAYLGNESCVETPWIYDFVGKPSKTQAIVRRALNELYSCTPAALPGNDDEGEMSSWYVFAALGMYPELPGTDVLVFGSPLFPKAVIHLAKGDLTVIGRGAKSDAPYVTRLKLDGQSSSKPWMRLSDLPQGGTLEFDLSTEASTHWGSDLRDAPPSYDVR